METEITTAKTSFFVRQHPKLPAPQIIFFRIIYYDTPFRVAFQHTRVGELEIES